MTASLTFASATTVLPLKRLTETCIVSINQPTGRSVEEIKQTSAPSRKFFIAKHTASKSNKPAASIRRQSGRNYRGGSLFEAIVELIWPANDHSFSGILTQEQRDQYVDQLPDETRDAFVQSFNQRLETSCQSINRFLAYIESTTVTRPYESEYQTSNQTSNQTVKQVLSHPCDLTSVISPLLYELGFMRESIDTFRIVQTTHQLQANINQVRQRLIDQMDEGFEFESIDQSDEAVDDDDINQETHAFDVLTLDHDDSESEDGDKRHSSVNDNSHSASRSPHSTSRARSAHKPIRSMPRKPTDVIHDRHTFASKPNQPSNPPSQLPGMNQQIDQANNHLNNLSNNPSMTYSPALLVDVAGARRQNPVTLPSTFISTAQTIRNDSYLAAELSGQARPVIKTSSTAKRAIGQLNNQSVDQSISPFTTFSLQPSSIDFGLVEQGQVYRAQLALTNVGVVKGRFAVREINQSTQFSLRVLCRPGLLAPGLQKRVEIELEPHLIDGVDGCDIEIDTYLEIATESAILRVPIHAQAIPPKDFQNRLSEAVQLGAPAPHRVTQDAVGFFRPSGLIGPLKQVKSNIGAIRKLPKTQPINQQSTPIPIVIDVSEAKEQVNSLMDEDWDM